MLMVDLYLSKAQDHMFKEVAMPFAPEYLTNIAVEVMGRMELRPMSGGVGAYHKDRSGV